MSAAGADTIVGVSTGTPDGGVAVLRISGPRAGAVAETLCGGRPAPRHAAYRAIGEGHASDRGLVLWFPGPGSFTGEDVLELHVHAGERNVRNVLEQVQALGVVPARAGEFTRRAFLNGRLDLAQAEGIAAVVGAETKEGLLQARRLVAGELGGAVEELREQVLGLRAEVEANLDFPDDVAAADRQRWVAQIDEVQGLLADWLGRFEAGRAARTRPRVVIAGPPNGGKSSLFNALLGRDRALVDHEAGTTRDYLEAPWTVGGREVWLVDTAGDRESDERVERQGVLRAREQAATADCLVWVLASDCDASPSPPGPDALCVETKSDLGGQRPNYLSVCSRTGTGVDELREQVARRVRVGGGGWIGLARHRRCVDEAAAALVDARVQVLGEALELAAFSLGVADGRLGEITGRGRLGAMGDRVMDAVFSRFCIGK